MLQRLYVCRKNFVKNCTTKSIQCWLTFLQCRQKSIDLWKKPSPSVAWGDGYERFEQCNRGMETFANSLMREFYSLVETRVFAWAHMRLGLYEVGEGGGKECTAERFERIYASAIMHSTVRGAQTEWKRGKESEEVKLKEGLGRSLLRSDVVRSKPCKSRGMPGCGKRGYVFANVGALQDSQAGLCPLWNYFDPPGGLRVGTGTDDYREIYTTGAPTGLQELLEKLIIFSVS